MSLPEEYQIMITSIGGLFVSIVGTYALAKFVDRYCSTDVDAAIIRMIEELNQARPKKIPVILGSMEMEERLRVLERVLDSRPYSKELGAQVKVERERAEENEKMLKMESALKNETETETVDGADDQNKDDTKEEKVKGNPQEVPQEEMKEEFTNILMTVWKEFGNKGNGNTKVGDAAPKDEVTETCAICMEDYKEDEDVIIGVNCVHMYHKDCLLKWMQAKHDFCPYCRCYVFPVSDFVTVAKDQLGEERFKELVEEDDPELVAMYIGSTGQSNDETLAAPKAGSTSA